MKRARVSLVTTATLGEWDVRRFRANVLLNGSSEDDLVGHEVGFPVAAGEATDLEIVGPDRETIYADLRVVPTDWDGHPALLVLLRRRFHLFRHAVIV